MAEAKRSRGGAWWEDGGAKPVNRRNSLELIWNSY